MSHQPDMMRWKLELAGTSRNTAQALETAVDDVGWTRHDTIRHFGLAVTRVYVSTEPGESAEHIAIELAERMTYVLPTVTRGRPATWPNVFDQLRRAKQTRAHHAQPEPPARRPSDPKPLPGFA